MTIRTRTFAIGVAAVSVLGTGAAMATHTFEDVPDGRYYTEPVAWAFANGITNGTSPTTFSPNDPVTRAQDVTFAYRYDQNVVQPKFAALDAAIAANASGITANTDGIATNADAITANTADIDANATAISTLQDEVAAPTEPVPQVHWARVDTDGTLTAGTPGAAVGTTDPGHYDVTFDGVDVAGCAWSVTARYPAGATPYVDDDGPVFVLQQGDAADQILVLVGEDDDHHDDDHHHAHPFQVLAIC